MRNIRKSSGLKWINQTHSTSTHARQFCRLFHNLNRSSAMLWGNCHRNLLKNRVWNKTNSASRFESHPFHTDAAWWFQRSPECSWSDRLRKWNKIIKFSQVDECSDVSIYLYLCHSCEIQLRRLSRNLKVIIYFSKCSDNTISALTISTRMIRDLTFVGAGYGKKSVAWDSWKLYQIISIAYLGHIHETWAVCKPFRMLGCTYELSPGRLFGSLWIRKWISITVIFHTFPHTHLLCSYVRPVCNCSHSLGCRRDPKSCKPSRTLK